jgi:hypothetical protein
MKNHYYKEEGFWYLLDISDVANFVEIGADERLRSQKRIPLPSLILI